MRLAVGLVRYFLEEFLPALLALELLLACVEQGVSLQTGGMGEGLGTFLADVRPEGALSVVVQVGGEVLRDDLLATDRAGDSLLRYPLMFALTATRKEPTAAADQL